MSEFTAWLNDQIRDRGWSISELARQSGFSQSLASDVLNEKTNPSANFVLRIALALGEDPVVLLRLVGHLPAALPETDLSCTVNELFRQLPDTQQEAIAAIIFELAGRDAPEHAPASAPSLSAQRLTEKVEAMTLWGDVCTEMEYCGLLLLEDWTDRSAIERHYLMLQMTLVNLLWALMEPDDHPDVNTYARRLLNAYRRHRTNKRGESEEAAKASST